MSALKELIVKIGANTKGLEQGVDQASGKLTTFGSMFGGLAKTALAAGATAGAAVGAIGFKAIEAGGKLEQSSIAFKTLLGSAENAGAFLKDLGAFASSTPFEFQGLQDASKQMLAFGFEAGEIIPTLTGVGDALSAVGKTEALPNVILQLGQMQAKGKASREELNILAENGIPVWQLLADTLGTDVSGAMDRVGKGALDADTAISALLKGIENSNAGGAMADQMESMNGAWSNVMDTFTQAFQRLGLQLIPSVGKPAVDVAKQIVDAFATVVDAITGVETETKGMKTVWGVDLGAMTTKAKTVFAEIQAVVGPAMDSITRIVEQSIGIVRELMAIPGMKESIEVVWVAIKGIFAGTFEAIAGIVTGSLQVIEGIVTTFHSLLKGDFSAAADGVELIVKGMWTAIKGVFTGGVTAIKTTLSGLKDAVLGQFSDIGNELVGNSIVPDDIVDPTIAEFGRMKTGATEETTTLKTNITGLFGDIGTAAKNLKIGESIFSGDFSAETWKGKLKSMGDAFRDKLAQPAIDAIDHLIETGLNKLLGVLDDVIFKTGSLGGSGGGIPGLGGGGGGGGLFSKIGGMLGGGDPISGAITAGATVVDTILSHFGRKRAESTANAIEENTRTHMLLFADYRQSVGFFQNDELQEQTANLEYIVANGDDMKGTLWSIRDILSGGIAVSGLTGSGVADIGDAVSAGVEKGTRGGGKGGAGSPLGLLDALLGPPSFTPSRSRTGQPDSADQPGGEFSMPTRSRTGQPERPPTAEEIGQATRDALEARNPLAVIAAQLGNPLAQLATGSNFMPEAVEEQTAAIREQIAETRSQKDEIRIKGDETVGRLDTMNATLLQFIEAVKALVNRPISIQIDGREIALVVGEHQEALGLTA